MNMLFEPPLQSLPSSVRATMVVEWLDGLSKMQEPEDEEGGLLKFIITADGTAEWDAATVDFEERLTGCLDSGLM